MSLSWPLSHPVACLCLCFSSSPHLCLCLPSSLCPILAIAGSITLVPEQSREPGLGLLPPHPWVPTSRVINSTLSALHPHFLLDGFHTISVLCSSASSGGLGFHFLENLQSWPCHLSGNPHPSSPLPGNQSRCASSNCIPGGLEAASSPAASMSHGQQQHSLVSAAA